MDRAKRFLDFRLYSIERGLERNDRDHDARALGNLEMLCELLQHNLLAGMEELDSSDLAMVIGRLNALNNCRYVRDSLGGAITATIQAIKPKEGTKA